LRSSWICWTGCPHFNGRTKRCAAGS